MNDRIADTAASSEVDGLSADLRTVMRMLQRMRGDLQRHHAWLNVESACVELTKARTELMRGK